MRIRKEATPSTGEPSSDPKPTTTPSAPAPRGREAFRVDRPRSDFELPTPGQVVRGIKGAVMPLLSGALGELGKHLPPEVMQSILGPAYPTDPVARAQERGRLEQLLSPLVEKMPAQSKAVVAVLRGLGVDDMDLFRGSHVKTDDGGRLYEQLKSLGATPRDSSHYPEVDCQQYELDLPGVGVVLFGKDAAGNTWLQVEAHGLAANVGEHALDTLKYLLAGQNIGPFGVSPHSEHADPLQVHVP